MSSKTSNVIDIASRRNGTKVWTPAFTGSFVNLVKPKAWQDKEAKYSILMLFEKNADLTHMRAAMIEAAKEKWGENAKKIVESPKFLSPFREQGEMVSKSGELYTGMKPGCICVNASKYESWGRPQVVDTENRELLDASELYSGAIYRATVVAWAYDNSKMGVSFNIENVQKLAEGDRLGGKIATANDDFEPIETPKTGTNDSDPSWD